MATTTRRTPARDHWVSVAASWETYLRHLDDRGERPKPKLIYENGRLTIVSPSGLHDVLKTRLGGMIEDLLIGLQIPHLAFGSTTLLKEIERRAGTEADESYYLRNLDLVRGKDDLLMGQDPAPDLVVEVAISRPASHALRVYRELGVGEVWVCKRSSLSFLVLNAEGRYAVQPTSRWIPGLTSAELTPWLFRADFPDDTARRAEFRRWVHDVLGPRRRGADPLNEGQP